MPDPQSDDAAESIDQVEGRVVSEALAPFTPQAYARLKSRTADYLGELAEEAARIARRRGSDDMVSASDVGRAIENLGVRPRDRRSQIVGTVGSLLFGAALGNVLQIAGASQITVESALLTFVVGAVGAAMTALGFVRD